MVEMATFTSIGKAITGSIPVAAKIGHLLVKGIQYLRAEKLDLKLDAMQYPQFLANILSTPSMNQVCGAHSALIAGSSSAAMPSVVSERRCPFRSPPHEVYMLCPYVPSQWIRHACIRDESRIVDYKKHDKALRSLAHRVRRDARQDNHKWFSLQASTMRSYISGIAEDLYDDCPTWGLVQMPEHFVQLHKQTRLGWWKAQRYLLLGRQQCELLLSDPYEVLWLMAICKFFENADDFKGNYDFRIVLTSGSALCKNSDIQIFDNSYLISYFLGWMSKKGICTISPHGRVESPRTRVKYCLEHEDYVSVVGKRPPKVIRDLMAKI